jgi:hypothetical protein
MDSDLPHNGNLTTPMYFVLINPSTVITSLTHGLEPHPVPFKIMPGAEYIRAIFNPHLGQSIPPSSSLYVRCTDP